VITRERRQKLAADQVTAEDEEKIDADPAETIEPAGRLETEEGGVIDRDDDDGESAEKIETRLAFTIGETRIDCYFPRLLLNDEKLAGKSFKKRTRCRPLAIGSG
jgi:hypothetical protein